MKWAVLLVHMSIAELKYTPPVSYTLTIVTVVTLTISLHAPVAFLPPTVSQQHIVSEGEDTTISCDDPNADPLTGSGSVAGPKWQCCITVSVSDPHQYQQDTGRRICLSANIFLQ